MPSARAIPIIVDRHAEDAAFLWLLRNAAVSAPHYSLEDLAELDNRLEAHIDGLRVAGEVGWDVCNAALQIGEPGEVFVAAVLAIESGDGARLDTVLAAVAGSAANLRAVVSALGWLEFSAVENLASVFCSSNQAIYRYLGVATYVMHGMDPGAALQQGIDSDNSLLSARSLRATGELGRSDLLSALREHWQASDEACRFWSVWSSVVLGDSSAQSQLKSFVTPESSFAPIALSLASRVVDPESARSWLAGLAQNEDTLRYALMGAGYTGNPLYVPSMLNQMAVPELARVAGEAFSLVTGLDLAYLDLDADWPEGFEAGPTEDPQDDNVELDQDEDLPWPNASAIEQWWSANEHQFNVGERYLGGKRISEAHCREVLLNGYQRQRQAAALELLMMGEGRALYEVRKPGFRQKRELTPGSGALE